MSGGPDGVPAAADGLAQAAVFGEFATVHQGGPAARGVPVRDLCADRSALSRHVATTREVLGERAAVPASRVELRVAASVWFLGLVARLVSAPVGARVLGAGWVRLHPADVLVPDEPGPVTLRPSGVAPSLAAGVLTPVVMPLARATAAAAGVAPRILVGNIASAVAGAAVVIAAVRPELAGTARDRTVEALAEPPLAGAGEVTAAGFVRASCCLLYRVPPGGLCGDCVLRHRSAPASRA
ncbi:(2Fe-2S)-binding protein [uncultured Jatrophihabitans sp.]|uniref:(2Fe-2S)-binding protein n=1 Tax=uncultured Jatrophihabitans sp. TaxID=1610747 RepID=UPI0035CC4954